MRATKCVWTDRPTRRADDRGVRGQGSQRRRLLGCRPERGPVPATSNLTGVTIAHARVVNVDVDAFVDHVTINGVDVTEYVNERDLGTRCGRCSARRTRRDAGGVGCARAGVGHDDRAARGLTEGQRHESVGGEWSFVETLRHLVFAMDKWFTVPILGEERLPSLRAAEHRLDRLRLARTRSRRAPTLDEVLAVRARAGGPTARLPRPVTPDDLAREVDVLENGPSGQRVHLHRVRGGVRAQPLRVPRSRPLRLTASGAVTERSALRVRLLLGLKDHRLGSPDGEPGQDPVHHLQPGPVALWTFSSTT